jgi:hypothetical protein
VRVQVPSPAVMKRNLVSGRAGFFFCAFTKENNKAIIKITIETAIEITIETAIVKHHKNQNCKTLK